MGAGELLLVLVPLGITLWALVDAALRPDSSWARAKQTKALWLILLAIGAFLWIVGAVVGTAYLVAIRPKLVGTTPPA